MDFESESVPWLLATYGAKTILAILTRVFNTVSVQFICLVNL